MTPQQQSRSVFASVPTAPPDPILGITDAFNADPRPGKLNLSIGVYQDAAGRTPVLATVKEAERRILDTETSKGYKPITGDPAYGKLVASLLFGAESDIVAGGRSVTAHTPGGTGALRVAGDYIARLHGRPTAWLSDPTWANHKGIFEAAGLSTKTYPYFDAARNGIDFTAMLDTLKAVPAGDIVLLHGCCHNPTGADPSAPQWAAIGDVLAERGAIPLVDFAYQGFADGIDADAAGLRALVQRTPELLVCSSFSKNFGLYNERTGAMTVVCAEKDHAAAVASQVKVTVRVNYSNPPAHGGAIVAAILGDAELRKRWEAEVADMRARINGMRRLFVDTMKRKAPKHEFEFIIHQRGMFSFSGLSKQQVDRLKSEFGVYIVGSGRINVAGMTEANMVPLCDAIAAVL